MPLIANVKLGERKPIHSSLSAPVKGAQWTFSFFATLSKLTSFGPNFNHQTNGDIPASKWGIKAATSSPMNEHA